MSKFKVGDVVKCMDNGIYAYPEVGELYEVMAIDKYDELSLRNAYDNSDDNSASSCIYESHLFELYQTHESLIKSTIKKSNNSVCDFVRIGDITLAVPKGCPVGIAVKHPDDEYSKEIGEAIAFQRMYERAIK